MTRNVQRPLIQRELAKTGSQAIHLLRILGHWDAKAEVSLPKVNPICRGQLRQRITGPQRYSERI
jgi:hypothetical protein